MSEKVKGKPYDAAVRTLIGSRPQDWLRFLNLPDAAVIQTLDTDLSFVTTSADGLLKVGDTEPYGLHFEFEAGHHGNEAPGRVCAYNLWAYDRYKLPFWSVLVLLKPEADSPQITGLWEQYLPGVARTRVHSFAYQMVRVWRTAPEVFLGGGLGMLPLAPIADVSVADLPDVIDRMTVRIDTAIAQNQLTESAANDLWAATFVLSGARYDRAFMKSLLGKVHRMRESDTYQAIIEEGIEEGIKRGIEQGRIATLKETLLRFGEKRFGTPPPSVAARILAMASLSELETLEERYNAVETWDELLTDAEP